MHAMTEPDYGPRSQEVLGPRSDEKSLRSRKNDEEPGSTSAMADIVEEVFFAGQRNFSGPLMRFACGGVRDLIVSHRNDQGSPYWRFGAAAPRGARLRPTGFGEAALLASRAKAVPGYRVKTFQGDRVCRGHQGRT